MQELRRQLGWHSTFGYELAERQDLPGRPIHLSFFFRPANAPGRQITSAELVTQDWQERGINPLELKERHTLACLRKAYPDPARSLWWHLRAWWRG